VRVLSEWLVLGKIYLGDSTVLIQKIWNWNYSNSCWGAAYRWAWAWEVDTWV